MRKTTFLFAFVIWFYTSIISYAQAPDWQWAKSAGGVDSDVAQAVAADKSGNVYVAGRFRNTYDTCQIIYIYTPSQGIYGIRVNGFAILYDYYSMARVILVTKDSLEVLIYEAYPWLYNSDTITITNKADESLYLEALDSTYIKVEIVNSDLYIENILFDTSYVANINILRTTHHDSIVDLKVDSINNNIQTDSLIWEADSNCLANLKYYQKKIFYNISDTDLLNTFGIEYYKNGVFSNIGQSIPAVTQSNLIDNFDWRNRHSENWVSPVKNQGTTSWCTSFATNGALESVINLYYNNITNIILSEKAYYSCLNDIYNLQSCFQYNDIWRWLCYQQNIGAMNIACCPFTNSTSGLCDEILCSPYNNFLWKSASFERITPNINPDLDDIKENLILYGPIPFANGYHSMLIVGFGIIQSGQTINGFPVPSNSQLIGQNYFIVKESMGVGVGNNGFINLTLFELNCSNPDPLTCPQAFHYIITPITPSVNSGLSDADIQCADTDGDGYYWWGIGGGPTVPAATCPLYTPAAEDCDDSDPLVGPYDNAYNCTPICLFDNVSTDIDADRIIDHNEYITTNITVKSGHKLTIENHATLFIHPLSQIVVEDGAELFLNNGSIKICSNAVWQGTITAGTGAVVKIENESVFVDKIISEWMPLNMNVGTMGTPSDDGIIQKYCYGNSEANCLLYGALYTWDEAMQYAASVNCDPCGPTTGKGGVQGICPAGFHIPSDKEWSRYEWRMENYITPTGTTSLSTFQNNTGYRGSTTQYIGPGDKMKATSGWSGGGNGTNTSGFTAIPSGWFGNGFQSLGSATYLWSATEYNSSMSFNRALMSNSGQSSRQSNGKTLGFSVRCLKDK